MRIYTQFGNEHANIAIFLLLTNFCPTFCGANSAFVFLLMCFCPAFVWLNIHWLVRVFRRE